MQDLRRPSALGSLALLALPLALVVIPLTGCKDVDVRLAPAGLLADDVVLEVAKLGRPDPAVLARRATAGDIDGASLLDEGACDGPCRALEITLFIQNRGDEPVAPPVVRFSSPPGRPPRAPVALTAKEISEGREGRIRALLSLWPEETVVEVRPSASVFIEVTSVPFAGARDADDAPRNE